MVQNAGLTPSPSLIKSESVKIRAIGVQNFSTRFGEAEISKTGSLRRFFTSHSRADGVKTKDTFND
jgi:hypothetical protein